MGSQPRRRGWHLRTPIGLVAIILVLSACGSGEDEGAATTSTSPESLSGDCAQVHAGHAVMMWTPGIADEMVTAGCGWPYEPFLVPLDGGTDDPALDTAFEPRSYDELWTAITQAGFGLCSVGTEPNSPDVTPTDGRAFGFAYEYAAPGCPGAAPTGTLRVSEYGTEAQRDAAANSHPADVEALVLGRWVLLLEGDAGGLGENLERLGAQRVR